MTWKSFLAFSLLPFAMSISVTPLKRWLSLCSLRCFGDTAKFLETFYSKSCQSQETPRFPDEEALLQADIESIFLNDLNILGTDFFNQNLAETLMRIIDIPPIVASGPPALGGEQVDWTWTFPCQPYTAALARALLFIDGRGGRWLPIEPMPGLNELPNVDTIREAWARNIMLALGEWRRSHAAASATSNIDFFSHPSEPLRRLLRAPTIASPNHIGISAAAGGQVNGVPRPAASNSGAGHPPPAKSPPAISDGGAFDAATREPSPTTNLEIPQGGGGSSGGGSVGDGGTPEGLGGWGVLALLGLRRTAGSVLAVPPPLPALFRAFQQPHANAAAARRQQPTAAPKESTAAAPAAEFGSSLTLEPTDAVADGEEARRVRAAARKAAARAAAAARLTVGGRALAKHAQRCQDGWWGSVGGGDEAKNARALQVVNRILSRPHWINVHALPENIAVLEVRVAEGYGARWTAACDADLGTPNGGGSDDGDDDCDPGVVACSTEDAGGCGSDGGGSRRMGGGGGGGGGVEFRGFLEPPMPNGHAVGWRH